MDAKTMQVATDPIVTYYFERPPHWGSHSGYVQLVESMKRRAPDTKCIQVNYTNAFVNFLGRFLPGSAQLPLHTRYRRVYNARVARLLKREPARSNAVYHVLGFLPFRGLLGLLSDGAARRVVVTIHAPHPRYMHAEAIAYLNRVHFAIVLHRAGRGYYEEIMGPGRVKFAHHGVDVDFFRPAQPDAADIGVFRLLFIGTVLRDAAQLQRIYLKLRQLEPSARLDMVLTKRQVRLNPIFAALDELPDVTVHSGITDSQLLKLYQQSSALILPLTDAGANNAVLESLATGLPIVTTDVAGLADYGGGTIFPVSPVGDDEQMLARIRWLIANPESARAEGAASRRFAVETLAWPRVVEEHMQIYREMAAS